MTAPAAARPRVWRGALLLALCGTLLPGAAAAAGDDDDDAGSARVRPLWEAGLAGGGGVISDYPGASQSHTRGLVLPVFIYRGRVLRIDERGIRSRLFDSPDLELDLAGSAAFDANDNDARDGMPALDYLFGIGPQLVWRGLRDRPGEPTLRLKARALFSSDFDRVDGRGMTIDAEVRWRLRPLAGDPRSTLTIGVQPTWASRPLHAYFYEVAPAEATPTRPAYRARAGYFGTELNLTWKRRVDERFSWFVALRGMAMGGAANVDSPLHRRAGSVSVGAGLVWTPWRSSAPAAN